MSKEKHGAPKFEYNYITDGIYIGTNLCCQTHFNGELKKKGIMADVSLEEEKIDSPFGAYFYAWIPVKNHTAPKQEQLEFGVLTLKNLVAMKQKIYLHCKNGHGRAPTMMAAYLIKTRGMSPANAEKFIKKQRPSIHLEPVQRKALIKFYKNHRA
ncbi:MAG: dual specificity protein phosphatase family protein [Candidatus Niyogibacteria bacterium]|nr:MAG: dual specificity protein phosphatase family protein [Candidatus Niyogibacteria bacterium]